MYKYGIKTPVSHLLFVKMVRLKGKVWKVKRLCYQIILTKTTENSLISFLS